MISGLFWPFIIKPHNLTTSPSGWINLIVNLIVVVCVLVISVSVMINFAESKDDTKVAKEKKSWVETASMTLFAIVFGIIIKLKLGQLLIQPWWLWMIIVAIGLSLIIIGTAVNVWGRLSLGGNWANQVRIYHDQTLITSGAFSLVRHPLYTSLIWMFTGASLVYTNYLSLFANWLLFVPMMYYRAGQEERVLEKRFKQYNHYQHQVGMFFPKKLWSTNQ